ncbi:MAG TPA: hypothetical protein VF364_03260 [Candidatus Limnocylindria bacterium]
MKRPIRAILYGLAIWWAWGLIVIPAGELLPESITSLPSFALARLLVLVLLVVGFAVDYLRRIEVSDAREGLTVGVTWMGLMILNDLGHFLLMGEPGSDIGLYLAASAPLYVFIPLITVALFGRLVSSERRGI